MPAQWRVLKFGGTSVDGRSRDGRHVVLVCLALAGAEPDTAGEHLLDALLQEHACLAAVHALHEEVVIGGANGRHPVFGPAWQELI